MLCYVERLFNFSHTISEKLGYAFMFFILLLIGLYASSRAAVRGGGRVCKWTLAGTPLLTLENVMLLARCMSHLVNFVTYF